MEKRVFVLFLFALTFLLAFPLISSAKINIKSYPNHDVMVSLLTPGSVYSLIESYHGTTDSNGMFSQTTPSSVNKFDLKVWIKNDDVVVVSDRFDGITSGETINIILYPGEVEVVDSFEPPQTQENNAGTTNETGTTEELEEAETSEEEQSAQNTPGITGLAASEDTGEGNFFSDNILYFIIGFLILAMIVFFTMAKLGRIHMNRSEGTGQKVKEVKVKKLSEVQASKKEKLEDYKKAIEEAEDKIKEAQKEINKLKNSDKIDAVRKKIEEDKKELERLTGNSD